MRLRLCGIWLGAIMVSFGLAGHLFGQTASTGAVTGLVLDPSGAALPGVSVHLIKDDGGEATSATSNDDGWFGFLSLPPGEYELQAGKTNFETLSLSGVRISVTETLRIELHLRLATSSERVLVSSNPLMVQLDSPALGRIVNEDGISSLPLVTRNFTQVTGLSPGVAAGVYNAGELGLGGTALSQIAQSNDGLFVHGMRSYDNNWQLDSISISDVQGSGASSGGIPIPNPNAIQEFKVQTALYDASYGRYAGANVSVITKTGGDVYHGSLFEFLRNNVLNANDFFLNQAGQPRAALKQNQFGLVLGGPIKNEKLFFFSSYQGTRQVNGLAAGQSRIACTATLNSPPLTNDRSRAALGRLFGGMTGALGGVAVKPDGSNINPVALALLNFKLPDGSFLIPTPQTLHVSKPFNIQGFSVFAQPCHFSEDQLVANIDFLPSQKNRIAVRFFSANNHQTVTFPGNFFNPTSNIQGFTNPSNSGNRVFSIADTHAFTSASLNEARIGYVRTRSTTNSTAPFKWSDVGVAEGQMNNDNGAPNLTILGSVRLASAFPRNFVQNSFIFSDDLSTIRRAHTIRVGGSVTRLQENFGAVGNGSFVEFLSWPDFLLGLDANGNGTGTFSNVYASIDDFGLFGREYRLWETSAFLQDDYKITKSLTLNLGLRYERLGQFGDKLGRNSSFDFDRANANPPSDGSFNGYIVASNFSGPLPPGVTRANNVFGNYGEGQNTVAPRIGFAWQILPSISRLVLRAGYGSYYSRSTGQAFFQSADGAPYSLTRISVGLANAEATFHAPFSQPFPTAASFPLFPSYSPTSATTVVTVSPRFRPAVVQQLALNIQAEVKEGWLLEVGYVGTRGTHLQRTRSLNQALDASPAHPIRGVTSDTVANIPLRVPIMGIPADSLYEVESEGGSWYNGLEASLTKRISHLQLLGSYTFSKTLDTDGADVNATSAGTALTLGDQNSPKRRWGRASFSRTHRFIFSDTWTLPSPNDGIRRQILGEWTLAGIVTVQSGTALTIADTNSTNVFGITEDRAQLTGSCAKNQLVSRGSVESKLSAYFNVSCFTAPPVIGADGIATAFGNSGTGIVDGPGQANVDIALSKAVTFNWPREKSSVEFRAELYNALNHPQFSNPDTNFTSPTFGVISSTAVSARVGQLALRFSF